MGGIAGIIRFDGGPAETDRVRAMAETMAQRGPDGIRHWSEGSSALAHLMLQTTPESLSERQPLVSADGQRVLVVHGRVDNREELAEALAQRGARPLDQSDAALFLAAYEAWGDDFPQRIEGDFALVIHDALRRAAICARDRIGAKPFLWHWDGHRLSFASEVRAVLDLPWVAEELDEATVAQFLMSELRSYEATFWRGIRRLAPGHLMVVSADGLRRTRYWRLDFGRRLRFRRDEEYAEHYSALLDDVVRRMSRSHRPVSFEVSGGLDSSALFAVADGLDRQGRLPAPGIAGYTLRFDEDGPANELAHARAVAAHLGRPVREIDPTRQPLDWYMAAARRSRDFPGYPNGVMQRGIVAAAAAESRVLIRGVGGDELNSGTPERYADTILRGEIAALPGMLRADWRDFGAGGMADVLLHGMVRPLLPAPIRSAIRRLRRRRPAPPPEGWLSARLAEEFTALSQGLGGAAIGVGFEGRERLLLWLVKPTISHHLELGERDAAGSVDVRNPFLNVRLIEFAAGLPERLLACGSIDRHLHRVAMLDLLPSELTGRRDKAEFSSVFWPPLAELGAVLDGVPDTSLEPWVRPDAARDAVTALLRTRQATNALWRVWSLGACLSVAGTVVSGED